MSYDLDLFVQRAGASSRRLRDQELAYGQTPVWMTAEENWKAFAQAVLRLPTDELRALFMLGWNSPEEPEDGV